MIPWINVKGTWKEPSAIWGKANGVWESKDTIFSKQNGVWTPISLNKDPFNEALALVGIDKVDTLEAVLTNSDYCTAMAGNADAYAIMKDNYSADMVSAVGGNFNDGLNLLNYKCGLKCYLIKGASQCTNITGGWRTMSNASNTLSFSMSNGGMVITFNSYGAVGTKNKVNMSRFAKVTMSGSGFDTARGSLRIQSVAGYDNAGTNLVKQDFSSATSTSASVSSITEDAYVTINDWGSGDSSNYTVAEMYMA